MVPMAGTIDKGMAPAPAPLAPARHPRRWPWALAAAVIALGVGIGIGSAGHSTATKTIAGPTVYQTIPGPAVTQTATQTVTASPPAPAAGSTLLTASGSGAYTTKQFTVGGSGNWDVQWTYSEGGFGQSVNFSINADNGSDFNFTDPNQLGTGGSGVVHVYNDAGTHYLTISSEGSWTIKVVTAP
jgi:hypothetical protein